MQRRTWLQAGAAALAAGTGLQDWLAQASTAPRKWAVLVGVGQLDYQPQHLCLDGPMHDVAHMYAALQAHGFEAAHMAVLRDAPLPAHAAAGQPTQQPMREHIMRSLQAVKPQPGDAVVLYWSGHGVRTRGANKHYREADDHSTWLLARDVQRTPAGSAWPLIGAVADAQVGAFIDRWLAAGAHVLAVMDTCHASSTTRYAGSNGLRWRGVPAAQLQPAQMAPSVDAWVDLPLPQLPAPQARTQRFVGLYACEAQQRTPEWQVHGMQQGLFTRALLQALPAANSTTVSYAQWARLALDAHAQLAHRGGLAASLMPRPVFEGSLQAPLWQGQSLPAWQAPVAQLKALPAQVQLQVQVQLPSQPLRVWDAPKWGASLELGALPVGTKVRLQVRNAGADALYWRVFHVGEAGRWQPVFPQWQGDAPLLPGAQSRQPTQWQHEWVVAAAPGDASAQPTHGVRCFAAPAQPHQWLEGTDAQAVQPAAWQGVVQWQVARSS